MSSLVTKNQINDATWIHHAEKNAEHRAKLFIDLGQPEKVAEALKELPYKTALLFLYDLGKKYLYHHDKRAETVVLASELLERRKIVTKEKPHHEMKHPHGRHIPLVKKHTVAEIFKKEI